jgi:uncharacterized membrane protein YidH (DUF202 family)
MREEGPSNAEVLGEVQILLAEKRTALASLRTGISVFALPLSVLGLLIATSRYYEIGQVLHLLIPLLALSAGLVVLGCYLVFHSILRIRHYDRLVKRIKEQYGALGELIG